MITLSPPASDSNKSKLLSSQIGGRIRDVSFSSYLDGAEETFILKLTESQEESNFKPHNPKCHEIDDEIDVFNADKYFNGRIDDEEEISPGFVNKGNHQNKNPELEMNQLIQSDRTETPSISSKSSLNSRSSLLLQNIPQKTNGKSNKNSFFSKLGCNCIDNNSVNVIDDNCSSSSGRRRPGKTGDFPNMADQHQNQMKSCPQKEIQSRKVGEDFMFPMLKSNRQEEEDDTENCARKSLEVFGTDVQRSRKTSGLSLEKRLNMLTWDGIDIEIPSKSTRLIYNDDSDSDASSDLFEIESFSTNPSQYFTTQTSDAMSRTTTGYAPSEASIDWSVVTASAADFVVMSDSEEPRTNSARIRTRDCGTYGKNSVGGGKSKRHSSILSGCYSHKAVMVVSDSYTRTADEQVSPPRH